MIETQHNCPTHFRKISDEVMQDERFKFELIVCEGGILTDGIAIL